ncbi:hypothetical protein HK105_201458 [Polyrhizophydium stewartii]|uniref:Gustatory receptor n=1 Tax=Polyrhizophydium stewartii TaxID=2732419 RepID=A0ABR4NI23_9FUNG
MNAIAQDNSLWRARFLQDWKLRTIDLSMSATPWSSDTAPDTCGENRSRSGGCNDYRSLYKIRWFTSPRRREMLSFEERALREGFFGAVVWDDFYEAMQRCYHLLVTPLKLVDSLVDLVQEARLCFNFHDMQVFCLLNMTSLVVLFMHELAIAIARFADRTRILFHIQLVLIPWSLVNDRSLHHLLTGAPLRINETLLFEILSGCCAWLRLDLVLTHVRQLSPLVSTLTLQILWAPVVCTVEELVFQYTKEELRGMDGPLMAAHNFIRVFTLCFQCCFGAAAYAGLVAVWTIQRRRLL